MSARKLQQDIDKTFKKVNEGIETFESLHDLIYQSSNATQKEKYEENLKKEIKKLQKQRDQIKSWAASNEIKDKTQLVEYRKRIETCMEAFKLVEKEMKTKAFSKEGLATTSRQDPKEREREELCEFLTEQVDEINRFLTEELEAETNVLQAGMKKKQKDNAKADRLSELEIVAEKLKWHESRLQLLLRSLQNGNVDNQVVVDIKGDVEEVVRDGRDPEFDFDAYEGIYDDCNLDNEEAQFGLINENDKVSSQDAQSLAEDPAEPELATVPPIAKKPSKPETLPVRRQSIQLKSPLPALSTLNSASQPPPIPKDPTMKPAPIPTTSTLKYASAAAAAAASDKNGVGIAPLPPPSGIATNQPSPVLAKASVTSSPAPDSAQIVEKTASPAPPPIEETSAPVQPASAVLKSPTLSSSSANAQSVTHSEPATPAMDTTNVVEPIIANDHLEATSQHEEVESIYHLPPGLQDLLDSFETTKSRTTQTPAQLARQLQASADNCPEPSDLDRPEQYRPQYKYATPPHYPQDILPIFNNPEMYENQRIDTDTLFYIFYYKQNTYQQYLAAKALKNQSWRFHKQYQTWFQRHEEPKQITEEYEQGTYRFFDYESTWMNRRKADFKFVYKFLEDEM